MNARSGKSGGRRFTFREETIVDELIQANATISKSPLAKDRVVVYNDDWNDKRVVDTLNERSGMAFSVSSVVRFRNLHLGQLPRSGAPTKPGSKTLPLVVAVARLTNQIAVLEERLAKVERYLCDRHGYELSTSDNGTIIQVRNLTRA